MCWCVCTHQIPGLVSLKRHPNVVFVGIDTLDDIRNNSYNELFVSGGCVVSDELVLNPDFITHGRSGVPTAMSNIMHFWEKMHYSQSTSEYLFQLNWLMRCFVCRPTGCAADAAGKAQFSRVCLEVEGSLQNSQEIKRAIQVLILHLQRVMTTL